MVDAGTGYTLIDVRTPEEFAGGSIPTAINVPLNQISGITQLLPRDADIVVYCRSGNRSGQAAKILKDLGYQRVRDFGAVGAWQGELVRS